MKDPGYISDAAWNQEAPYRDADWHDVIQDERWDAVAGSDFTGSALVRPDGLPPIGVGPDDLSPTGLRFPGAVPDVADRDVTPMAAAGLLPGGGQPF